METDPVSLKPLCDHVAKITGAKVRLVWNCQEMCSQRIPKICNRQVSGGMVSQPG